MSRGRTLTGIVLSAALVAGAISCRLKVEPRKGLETPLQDIDGDTRPDLIFAVDIRAHDTYYVFFKRNLGDGKFGAPQFLYASDDEPEGMPRERVKPNSDRSKYYLSLVEQAEGYIGEHTD